MTDDYEEYDANCALPRIYPSRGDAVYAPDACA